MKADRELLELAARAAGQYAPKKDCPKGWEGIRPETFGCFTMGGEGATPDYQWNPLQDDGDALRLLASMREKFGSMLLAIFEDRVECGDVNYCQSIEDIVDGDIPRAVRRAITRAAAQIQLNKETK